jgi:glutamate-5-semialdehyde dehydrogenase
MFDSLKSAQTRLALATRAEKDAALRAVMKAIDEDRPSILGANASDVARARAGGMKESLVDRLALTDGRVDGMIEGIGVVVRQDTPVGRVLAGWTLPTDWSGADPVPMGVAAIHYESRPNVTADAFCLAYKAAAPSSCAVPRPPSNPTGRWSRRSSGGLRGGRRRAGPPSPWRTPAAGTRWTSF